MISLAPPAGEGTTRTTPRSALVRDLVACDANGYIETDAHMRTSVPGVYAAGDVRVTPLRQVITAAADGAVAATMAVEYLMQQGTLPE